MDSAWTGDGLVVDCLPGGHEALFPFPAPQETKSLCSEDDSSGDSGTTRSMYRARKCWQVVQVAKDFAVMGLGFELCFVEEES